MVQVQRFDLNLPYEEETQIQNLQDTVEREVLQFRKALGFRFVPNDIELVFGYLNPLAEGKSLPETKIHKENIYNLHPDEIEGSFEKSNDTEFLFFTPRSRLGGERASRSAKNGFWHATTGRKNIRLGNSVIGEKQKFCFSNGKLVNGKPPKEGKTNWLMIEYKLIGSNMSTNNMMEVDSNISSEISNVKEQTMDYVLSKIYHNSGPVENYKENYADFVKDHQQSVIEDENLWKELQSSSAELFSKKIHS